MTKKYEFTGETKRFGGVTLHRIRALRSVGEQVKPGDMGGWIEKEENLSHAEDCWVADDAMVYDRAVVSGNARVYGNAEVYGNADVYGDAAVYGNADVYGDAAVYGNARVRGNADYMTVKGLGSEYRNTTIFRVSGGGIGVSCGCFYGTLDKFREKVKERHGESKYAKEYMLLADMAQVHFQE